MFYDCESLTTLDISNFNTSHVKHMSDTHGMFRGCVSLTTECKSKLKTQGFDIN